METAAGKYAIRNEQVKSQRQHSTIDRKRVTRQQEDEYSTDQPDDGRNQARNPQLLASVLINESRQTFQDFRLDGHLGFPLLDGKFALPLRDACQGFIVHATRFGRRKQLPRGMKIQWQVCDVINADRQGNAKQEKQSQR